MAGNNKLNSKDVQAFVVGGLFVIGLVFATYKYFNTGSANPTEGTDAKQGSSQQLKDKLKDLLSTSTMREDTKPASSTNLDINTQPQKEDRVATDYQKGDINKGSYTVKAGDTLWEIAEALYGDGFQWTQILEANKADIGFLPNGSQAFIVTGQVLTLP